ncbi:hypothetical protein HD806DRAFT_236949 [Xylariaceae sp. AK1471]|nr:hypothetical protein HD806DRAFT_236949 [Xylariaceae sp. AK1471]
MAVPGTTQALIAAFSFGILFNAASAALVLYTKGQGSAIYRDGLRLALILFLISSLSWAFVEFLTTLVDPRATSTCQVAVIFSSLFDQFGRVFVEQYLAWAVQKRSDAKTPFSVLPQILVFGRLFVGIAFIAVTRTQFKPTCVPVSSIRAVSVVTIALDAVIIGLLSVHAFSNGLIKENLGSQPIALGAKTIRWTVVGVAVWWGTSVTSLLGFESIDLFYRTALPGIGLTILVGLVSILSHTLVIPREPQRRPDSPVSREIRDLSSSDSADYPPSRYEDLKGVNSISISALASKIEASRIIRRNDDGTFPAISRPMVAGLDMNGNPTQEQFSSATKPSNLAPTLPTGPPFPEGWQSNNIQKSTVDRMNLVAKPKAKMGKMAISNPILSGDESTQNPLNKIPTIDLAEAASNERMRREKYAQRISTLVAQRPAPRPPSMVIRPQMVGELERFASTKTNKTSSGLSVEGNASSTATQLSPSVDAVRRRSPRQPEPVTLATPFKVIRPGEPIRIPIPRPPERDQDPLPTKPEPVKTPLQRRPTTGLPSNPRAQTLKSVTKESGNQEPQTVMFVNDIVYNNPNTVGDIIQGVAKVPQPPGSGNSVVNRPRPIPRKGDKDRQVFPAEISPTHHRRSKSGGSLVSRKSILQLLPGSPTGLPSLPPMPQMTGTTTRAVPNNTKSMTIEEKMSLLYPAPLSAPSSTEFDARRRSSVPDLPPIPAILQDEQLQLPGYGLSDSESNNDAKASIASKRTTVRTSSILGIRMSSHRADESNNLGIYVDTRNPADEVGNSWLPGIPFNTHSEGRLVSGEVKRRSSPVLPMSRQLSMSTVRGEAQTGDEETMTNWGSVHSPVVPVSRQNARSTYIRKDSRNVATYVDIPIMMFDTSFDDSVKDGQCSDSEIEESPSGNSDIHQHFSGQFHRRVGDECPTFSTRKDKTRSRKMPPPTPLLLNGRSTKRAIVVQTAEPSPVESPGAAYKVIQAQLKNFEQPDRDSVESPGRRLALLANLEQEMGQLETKWQSTHDHLGRDSMSSIQTSPSRNSRPTSIVPQSSRSSSQRLSVASTIAERRASRRARMQNGRDKGTITPSSQNSSQSTENAQAILWQTRLAEAQVKYIEHAPELLMRRNNLNFLSVSKAGLGSPSPPETDESDSDAESEEIREPSSPDVEQPTAPIRGLWIQRVAAQKPSSSWLWDPQTRMAKEHDQSYELPGLSLRPAARKIVGSLTIASSRLWQSSSKLMAIKAAGGLWNNQSFPGRLGPVKASGRPVTMRPPRKNKRITLLPDIIENPEPLPDKRGTLGIFQFPWGERSEHATMQYRPSQVFMAMPGTMTTGRPAANPPLDAGVRQLEATDYSSSFFDEYDEEEGDNFSDFSGSGDDDFDETTLWEIASLLKTDQIPSKNSLLPMSSQSSPSIDTSVLADYVIDIPSDDEHEDDDMADVPNALGHKVAVKVQRMSNNVTQPRLWTPRHTSQDHLQNFGLPQHENFYWSEHTSEPANRIRARPRAYDPELIRSTGLWSPIAKEKAIPKAAYLWAASEDISELQAAPYTTIQPGQTQHQAPGLWVKSGAVMDSTTQRRLSTFCLPEPDTQIWQKLVSQMVAVNTSKPRIERILPSISSSKLWSARSTLILNAALYTPCTVQASQKAATVPITLWTQISSSRTPEQNGLYKPGDSRIDYRTTANPPAALSLSKRSHRRINTPLQPVTSTTLWSLKNLPSSKSSMADHWKPNVTSQQVAILKPMPAPTVTDYPSSGLWKRPTQARKLESSGLFDHKATGYDFRRLSKSPAVVFASARPHPVREPLSTLTSYNLWTPQHLQLAVSEDKKGAFLWSGKLPEDIRTPAFFILDPGRKTDYRTTSADSAALAMIRRPRTIRQPLQRLQSTQLWVNSHVMPVELSWITMCTFHPSSPSASSPSSASSSSFSASTDIASASTSATAVSTTATPSKSKGSFFSSWFGKKTNKDSAATGPAEQVQLNVTIPSRDLTTLPDNLVVKNLDNIPHAKPSHTALRHRYRSTIAYNANWDVALAEAIVASYPGTVLALRASYPQDWDGQLCDAITASHVAPKITRNRATPRDWSVALHSAIVESHPEHRYSRGQTLTCLWNAGLNNETLKEQELRLDFDVTVQHPVFMGSLKTHAETAHPALTGYHVSALPCQFDVALRHPVFFGSSSPSTYKNVHPAMQQSKSQHHDPSTIASALPSTISLWTKPSESSPATLLGGLWIPSNEKDMKFPSISQRMHSGDAASCYPRKGNKTGRPSVLTMETSLGKQGLWKRGGGNRHVRHPSSLEKNWLEDSMNKRFTRIELRY